MPSFGEGFASGLSGQLSQQSQSRLELALLSKKIEMESGAKQQEMAQAHQYQMIPENQAKGLASGLGLTLPDGIGDIEAPTLNALLEGGSRNLMAQAMIGRNQTTANPVYDKQTGIHIGDQLINGFGGQSQVHPLPGAGTKLDEARFVLNAQDLLNQMQKQTSNIDFGRLSGLGSKVEGMLGMNPQMTQFNNLRGQFATITPELIGGFKRFNYPEITMMKDQTGATSTPAEWKAWLDGTQQYINNRAANLGMGEDPNWQRPDPAMNAAVQHAYNTGLQHGSQAQQSSSSQQYLQSLAAQFGQAKGGKSSGSNK